MSTSSLLTPIVIHSMFIVCYMQVKESTMLNSQIGPHVSRIQADDMDLQNSRFT